MNGRKTPRYSSVSKINVVLHIIDKGYYEKLFCVFFGCLILLLSNQQIFAQTNPDNTIFKPDPRNYKETYFPYIQRPVYINNKNKFIIAQAGDTYNKIANKINIDEADLRQYNDVIDWKDQR